MFVRLEMAMSGSWVRMVLLNPLLPGQVFLMWRMIPFVSAVVIDVVRKRSLFSLLGSAVLFGSVL